MTGRATVITIYDPLNIGNRLQNYAVQRVLRDLDFEVSTVTYPSNPITWKMRAKKILQQISNYHLPGNKDYWKALDFNKIQIRLDTFKEFNRKYICMQKIKKIGEIKSSDYYILGSDQVWNPTWYNECKLKKDLFLLTFARSEKKICFAPSFGVEKLPEKWEPWFKKYLIDIPRLSVREDAGARILKEYTGKDAFVMIDPTLMLDRNEWNEIAAKPMHIDTKKTYILTYFLGGRSTETECAIKEYAEQLYASVYHLVDPNQPDVYVTGPSEFLYLIAHAKLVLTDSFHACVFSFLYEKPFLVYDRQGADCMISRIETLLRKFDLERKYTGNSLKNELLECDYSVGYKILLQERQKALRFLKVSLHLENE